MLTITEKEIRLEKGTLHCLTGGNRGMRDILLLHGKKFEAETWRDLRTLHELAEAGFHAVALDMPGYGKSPEAEMGNEYVLRAFIQVEQLDRPILLGPSMGGKIALEFALAHPQLVGGLILVGAVGIEEYKDRLSEIKKPTLLVWGSNDTISPPANGELLAQEIENSKLVIIDNAPHPCYLEQPDLWHDELINFLRSNFH
ncbi:MAG: alpha/beta hydrolase [Desulfobulbaceae bacterium]|nr:alpha/beta hydrolase [Desulfobulbaceae bacterium]